MNAKCAVCGKRLYWKRSRTYCSKHYWRLRRLAQLPRFELDRVAAEADHTKRLIEIVTDAERTDDHVADLQRGRAVPSEWGE